MSDENTEVVAAETPAAEAVGEPVATTEATETPPAAEEAQAAPEEPQAPLTRREVRKRRTEKRAADKAAAASAPEDAGEKTVEEGINTAGRKYDKETGKLLPEDGEPPIEAPPATTPEATQVTEPEGTEPKKPEPIRVDIPEGHSLREMGKTTFIMVATEEEARVLKASFNATHTRRNEVERVTQQRDEERTARRAAEEKNLRTDASQAATEKWMQTPRYKELVEENQNIRDAHGDGPASTHWDGAQGELRALRDAEYTTRSAEAAQARDVADGERWVAEARENAMRVPDMVRNLPQFGELLQESLDTFVAKVQMGHYPNVDTPEGFHEEFTKMFTSKLFREPDVISLKQRALAANKERHEARAAKTEQARAQAAATTETVKKEAVATFQKEAAERRVAAPPNPLGSVSTPSTPSPAAGPGETTDTSKMSANELRKHSKKSARARSHVVANQNL